MSRGVVPTHMISGIDRESFTRDSTVIDWFQPWPEDALLSVGQRFLGDSASELVLSSS